MTVLAITSCPTPDIATTIARALVTERLAACVTQLPGARSIYAWRGELEDASEVVCLIKTTQNMIAALRTRLVELHPYEVPELMVFEVEDGLPAYLEWIKASVAL